MYMPINRIRMAAVTIALPALLSFGITITASKIPISGWTGALFAAFVFIVLYSAIRVTSTYIKMSNLKYLSDLRNTMHRKVLNTLGDGSGEMATDLLDSVRMDVERLTSAIEDREAECRAMAKRMVEQERLISLGQLAAGVAHEINNPLCGIVTYSHLLLEKISLDDSRRSNVEKIIRESNRCKVIIKSLLNYARQSEPSLSPININDLVTHALANLGSDPVMKGIRIKKDWDDILPTVPADISQIQEVFENIIRNAAEILDGEGEIRIVIRTVHESETGQYVEISIEDTGPGIPEEYLTRLFDPFFTTKTKGHCTGLGLSVSYGIIRRHHGSISASNREGGGAVFTLKLPCEV